MATMTKAQKEALERGYEMMEASELLAGYILKTTSHVDDDHLAGLLNLVARSREAFDVAYDGAYREHEDAEDVQREQAPNVVPLAGKIARRRSRRARKAVAQ